MEPTDVDHVRLACRSGDAEALNKLLEEHKAVDRMDDRGWRPIHEAAYGGHTSCLESLMIDGGSDLNWQTREGETPLVLSLRHGHRSAALTLIAFRADPNITCNSSDKSLHFAVENWPSTDCVEKLLEAGTKVNCRDGYGVTPLHLAAKLDFNDVAVILLYSGALIGEMDDWGRNAIFIAAENGSVGCLKLFVERIKSVEESMSLIENVCVQANDGVTTLMIAAQNGHIECLRLLIEKGADVNRLANDGATALNLAIKRGHLECVKLLCPLTRKELKIRTCDSSYTCVLHSAIKTRQCQLELLCLLLDDGADLSACLTPFPRWNSELGYPPFLHFLPHIRCCFNIQHFNLSLLSSAVEKHQPECVLEIIRRGGEVNPTSNNILHPLIIALSFKHLNMVRLLLDNGANPNYQFKGPQCPMILMLACSNLDALVMILKCGGDLRFCFPERDTHVTVFSLFNPEIFNRLNCVRYIVSIFTGTTTNLSFDVGDRSLDHVIGLSCPNLRAGFGFKRKAVLSPHKDYFRDDCLKLISGIDSTSLQHRCRIKIVQTVLEANNWAPLEECLKRLPISPILINYLLYKDDQKG